MIEAMLQGRTLEEIAGMEPRPTPFDLPRLLMAMSAGLDVEGKGVSVFIKQPGDPEHAPGKHFAEDFSLRQILQDHPELRQAKIVNYNPFYGMSVFRVVLPDSTESKPEPEDKTERN